MSKPQRYIIHACIHIYTNIYVYVTVRCREREGRRRRRSYQMGMRNFSRIRSLGGNKEKGIPYSGVEIKP